MDEGSEAATQKDAFMTVNVCLHDPVGLHLFTIIVSSCVRCRKYKMKAQFQKDLKKDNSSMKGNLQCLLHENARAAHANHSVCVK